MTEPTYEFVKGKGWIPSSYVSREFIDAHGAKVRLTVRYPNNQSERFIQIGKTHPKLIGADGFVDLDRVQAWLVEMRLTSFARLSLWGWQFYQAKDRNYTVIVEYV